MLPRLTVLASGSAGNASLISADGFGLLIDLGIGPRQIARRLAAAGQSWDDVHAAILTHTHADHWHARTLAHLLKREIPLYCHAQHLQQLWAWTPLAAELQQARLLRTFESGRELRWPSGLRCRPFPVKHDGGATFGFRIARPADLFGRRWELAYASDLGCWDAAVVDALRDVDVLAIEFNHDVEMQHRSGRSASLIRRVLGDRGHLSNAQAAELLREVLTRSAPGRLRHLVQLHLSRDCNRPEFAVKAAREVLACGGDVEIHTALQDEPTLVAPGAVACP